MRGLGTLINTLTVLAGGGLGLLIGDKIPDRVRVIIVQVIGLTTLAIGLRDVIDTDNIVFPLVGMVLGGIVGALLARARSHLSRRRRVSVCTPGLRIWQPRRLELRA